MVLKTDAICMNEQFSCSNGLLSHRPLFYP